MSADVQGVLFERFEEMCRRRDVSIPGELRPAVYRLLALEAAVNASVFEAEPRHVASATVLHGSLGYLAERFPEYAGLLRKTLRHSPTDPEGVLTRTREIEARLAEDERFADFRDTPFVFRVVAIGNPTDPEDYLLRARAAVDRLAADERFADFRDTPGLFRQAAVRNTSDPEGYLTRVRTTTARLAADDRFAHLRGTPHLFGKAAANYPSDPEGFLAKELARRRATAWQGCGSDDDRGR